MSNRKELWSNPTQSHYKKTYEHTSGTILNVCRFFLLCDSQSKTNGRETITRGANSDSRQEEMFPN